MSIKAQTGPYTIDTLTSRRQAVTHLVRDGSGKIVDGTQFKGAWRARDLCNELNRAWGDGYASGRASTPAALSPTPKEPTQ